MFLNSRSIFFVDRDQRDFEGLGQAHIINNEEKKGTKD